MQCASSLTFLAGSDPGGVNDLPGLDDGPLVLLEVVGGTDQHREYHDGLERLWVVFNFNNNSKHNADEELDMEIKLLYNEYYEDVMDLQAVLWILIIFI